MTEPTTADERPVVGATTRNAARAVVALSVAEVVGKVATFAVIVGAARTLGPRGFGAFAYDLAIALLLGTFVDWGFDAIVTRRGSRDRATLDHGYADLVVLRLGLSLVTLGVIAVVLAAGDLLDSDKQVGLLVLCASTLVDTLSDAGRAASAAIGRQASTAFVLVGQRVLTAVVALVTLAAGGGLLGVASGYLAGSLAGAAVMALTVRRLGVALRWRQASVARIRSIVRESMAIGVNGVVSDALFRFDAVLLGLLAGTLAVGRYAAAYRLLETVMFINWAVARAVFPVMAAAREDWRVRRGVERGIAVCTFAFAPYAALLLIRGGDLLRLFYGAVYTERVTDVLAWLAAAPLAFGVAYLFSYALVAMDRSRTVLIGSVTALVANTVANVIVIPHISDIGTAITTTASYVLEAVVLWVPLTRAIGRLHLGRGLLAPLLAVVPAAATLWLPVPVVPAAAVELVVFLGSWVVVARLVDPESVAVLRSLVPRRST
jgi:O-antigen/teichoic acid export membrane protein